MKVAHGYILTSKNRRLYIGVSSNLSQRIWQHKVHWFPKAFTSRYQITRLVFLGEFPSMGDAITWEKRVKGWTHAKKAALIAEQNPRWNDLAWDWYERIEEAKRAIAEGRRTGFWPGDEALKPGE